MSDNGQQADGNTEATADSTQQADGDLAFPELTVGKAWGESISKVHAAELEARLQAWEQEEEHGERRGPFDGEKLTGADVFWLTVRSLAGTSEPQVLVAQMAQLRSAHDDGPARLGLTLPTLNLAGANLRRAQLAGAALGGVRLAEARLNNAQLTRATLLGADLSGASLTDADLSGADLFEANLTATSLDGADLSDANLQVATLTEAALTAANLSAANLDGATLMRASLDNANLTAARLVRANLSEASLNSTAFAQAFLREANLSLATADLVAATFTQAHLPAANLAGANVSEANLSGANLVEATLSAARLDRVDLSAASLDGANLSGADLGEAILVGTSPRDARLSIATNLGGIQLSTTTILADVVWNSAPLARVAWEALPVIGDESRARQRRDTTGIHKGAAMRRAEYAAAVRAYRLLAVTLHSQGLNEHADRYAYRAQVMQRAVLRRQKHVGAYGFSLFLWAVTGYGYRLWRIIVAYLAAILVFAAIFYGLAQFGLIHSHPNAGQALLGSLAAFHERAFSSFFNPLPPHQVDPVHG